MAFFKNEITRDPNNMLQFKDTSLLWGRSVNWMLEREEYKTHYENIMNAAAAMPENNAFLVAGTPGVGKTMAIVRIDSNGSGQ